MTEIICHDLMRRNDIGLDTMIAFIDDRPEYCDRGRWRAIIDIGAIIDIHPDRFSNADPILRYYFDLAAAKSETMQRLKAKGIDTAGAEWIERKYPVDPRVAKLMEEITRGTISEAVSPSR